MGLWGFGILGVLRLSGRWGFEVVLGLVLGFGSEPESELVLVLGLQLRLVLRLGLETY